MTSNSTTSSVRGRPLKYSKDFVEQFYEIMDEEIEQGGGIEAICVRLNISESTYHRWQHEHEEWKDVCGVFKLKHQAFVKKWFWRGANGANGEKWDPRSSTVIINNVCGWSQRQAAEGGTSINIQNMNVLNNANVDKELVYLMEKYKAQDLATLTQMALEDNTAIDVEPEE